MRAPATPTNATVRGWNMAIARSVSTAAPWLPSPELGEGTRHGVPSSCLASNGVPGGRSWGCRIDQVCPHAAYCTSSAVSVDRESP
ncbi:hypothetical protein [Streptomyces malaysiensis]|uniref:hypothetical protein n=1 Tax=Streptomyces malaysiensis TaxID=92644 RepID=UPI003404A322